MSPASRAMQGATAKRASQVTLIRPKTRRAIVAPPAMDVQLAEAESKPAPFRWVAAAADLMVLAFRGPDELPAEPVAPVRRDFD